MLGALSIALVSFVLGPSSAAPAPSVSDADSAVIAPTSWPEPIKVIPTAVPRRVQVKPRLEAAQSSSLPPAPLKLEPLLPAPAKIEYAAQGPSTPPVSPPHRVVPYGGPPETAPAAPGSERDPIPVRAP